MDGVLSISLFGPVRVLIDGEPMPHVRSRKALWLLALLVLRNGRPASREWVAGMLWPDAEGSVGLANLRPIVSELRRALGNQGERLRTPDRNSLVFDLESVEVDVLQFDLAVKRGDDADVARLYAGVLLEGCPEEWSHQERNVREKSCLNALLALADRVLTGDPGQASTFYARATGIDPWHDAPRRGLMNAFAAVGDVNAALQVYREFAQALSSEAGLAPEPATTLLYERLRAQSRRTVRSHAPAVPADRFGTPAGSLPQVEDDLVGREDERTDVAARLRNARLVTLTGSGGIGKTRLALAVAADVAGEFPDGVWFVPLDALTEGRQVATAASSILGLREEKGQSPTSSLVRRLREKRLLIVLDNCEHLLAACTALCREILGDCGGVRILATSREPLATVGERTWPVPSLAFPEPADLPAGRITALRVALGYESVRLFVERAKAAVPDFELLTDNLADVVGICARLDGIPLAIEMAAAQTRTMAPQAIGERLDDALRLLTAGFRVSNGRQHALRATFDWSYALLDETERTLFHRLAAFSGGWTLEAAETVGGEAADRLGSLVDRSLVVFDASRNRYRLLETVRQYAAAKLEASGEAPQAFARHRAWCLDLAERASTSLKGDEQGRWLAALDAEQGNLGAALSAYEADPGGAEEGLRLACALGGYWYLRRIYGEGRERLRRALDRFQGPQASPQWGRGVNLLGTLTFDYGDFDAAQTCFQAAFDAFQSLEDGLGAARAALNLANVQSVKGDDASAKLAYQECLAIYEAHGDAQGVALVLGNLGLTLSRLGDLESAHAHFEESLAGYRALGNRLLEAQALERIGQLAAKRGDFAASRAALDASREIREAMGDEHGIAWSQYCLGESALLQGDLRAAEELLGDAQRRFEAFSAPRGVAAALRKRANLLVMQGSPTEADAGYRRAEALLVEAGDALGVAQARAGRGHAASVRGDLVEARRLLVESLETFRDLGERRHAVRIVLRLAGLAAASGDETTAVRLWSAGSTERTKSAEALPAFDEAELRRGVAGARAVLGEAAFAHAWEEGAAMAWPNAVEDAMRSGWIGFAAVR